MLQQHQYRAEIDRHQLVQQIHIMAGGAYGPQAAAAIRHVAVQNGVMSFDNIGAALLKAGNNIQYVQQPNNGAVMEVTTPAMAAPSADTATSTTTSAADAWIQEQQHVQPIQRLQPLEQVRIEDYEYRFVFNNCSVGMAVASMAGRFIDCNELFCKLSSYSKQEISAKSIFNLTARQDMQHAFDLLIRLISPSGGVQNQSVQQQPVVVRGEMNNGNDLGLSVTLVKTEDSIAKCFCVTLIKNPTSPFDDSKQINELRDLLSAGGVIVPKGTKSSVLTETANYIRMLQQHQYRAEIDRHQLVQQIQIIAGGAYGPQAAAAIRHVAAQNGVMSFDNIGAALLKAGNNMQYVQQSNNGAVMEVTTPAMAAPSADTATSTTTSAADASMQEQQHQVQPVQPLEQVRIEDYEYRFVFNNCSVGMAVASMAGRFIDCNELFCKLSSYSKQEISAKSIFNLTARQDMQHAFDLLIRLISPSGGVQNQSVQQQPVVVRGEMNNGNDLGLSVTLVKTEDSIAKCFCVTLIKNPTSPFGDARPIPATIELV